MNYLSAHPWAPWAALALVAAMLEMSLPSFAFLFIAVGGAAAIVSAAVGGNLAFQSIVFTTVALATLLVFRPRRTRPSALPSRTEALVGREAEVSVELNLEGRVVVDGGDWAAKASARIAVGARVRITSHDGIVLNVEEL